MSGLRARATRGTILNAGFAIGFTFLGFLKGLVVAAFLSPGDYGIWSLLIVSLTAVVALSQVGVDDKYVQQRDEDQEEAFQLAFTLQLALSGVFVTLVLVSMPLFALAYGTWDILVPGWTLALVLPAAAFQAPIWVFYRDMRYLRQRLLLAVDPVLGLVVTLALAAAGLGYWALVIGLLAGAWGAALAAVRASPYPLRLRTRPGVLGEYVRFSGPLLVGAVSGVVVGFVPVLLTQRTDGIAAVGALGIASTISAYANRVDEIVTDTLYPAVCAVRDRAELLLETFLKSNRLALLWAAPVGIGAVLFGPDLVGFVLGDRWRDAVFVIQMFGLSAAVNQVAFNWTAYFRAVGNTGPIAKVAIVTAATVVVAGIPLLFWRGVDGFGVGLALAAATTVAARLYYLRELFPLGPVVENALQGVLPALPAAAAVLAVRYGIGGHDRGPVEAVAEVAVFVVVAVGMTALRERALFSELRGYLRRPAAAAPA